MYNILPHTHTYQKSFCHATWKGWAKEHPQLVLSQDLGIFPSNLQCLTVCGSCQRLWRVYFYAIPGDSTTFGSAMNISMAPLGSNREDGVDDVGSHVDEVGSEAGLPLRLEQAEQAAAPASSSGPESIHLHDVWRPDMGKNLSHTHRGCHPTQSWIWILNFLIAISVAVCSQVVHYGMEILGDLRIYLIDLVLPNVAGAWGINFLTCIGFVAIACKCVEWQPSSISSGIPGLQTLSSPWKHGTEGDRIWQNMLVDWEAFPILTTPALDWNRCRK